MGTILTIKGANFSNVAIEKITIPRVIADISNQFVFQDGYAVNSSGSVVTAITSFYCRYKEVDVSEYAGKKMLISMVHYTNESGAANVYAAVAFKTANGYNSEYTIKIPKYSENAEELGVGAVRIVEVQIPSDVVAIAGTYVNQSADWYIPLSCKIIG